MIKIRYTFVLGLLAVVGLIGWRSYVHFFDTTIPMVKLSGISNGEYYSGDISCTIQADKSGEITLLFDGNPLLNHFVISGNQEYPFTIPTHAVSQGKHALTCQFIDSRFNKNKTASSWDLFVDNMPLQANFVRAESSFQVLQGRTLHVQLQTNKEIDKATISVLSKEYECFPEAKNSFVYEAFIPVSCEEIPNEYYLTAHVLDKVGNDIQLHNKVQVVMFPFKKQSLQVSDEKVKEEEQLGIDNRRLEEMLDLFANNSPREKLWHGSFCLPIDMDRITCDFGAIRTTKHKGRYMHKALDLISAPKSVVWASQAGIVVLKERFALTGNTVVIDHGLGVMSLYCHLDSFANINVGDRIALGNPIGTLGKTGYASGYHLHWELRVNNIAVDPMQWTSPTF